MAISTEQAFDARKQQVSLVLYSTYHFNCCLHEAFHLCSRLASIERRKGRVRHCASSGSYDRGDIVETLCQTPSHFPHCVPKFHIISSSQFSHSHFSPPSILLLLLLLLRRTPLSFKKVLFLAQLHPNNSPSTTPIVTIGEPSKSPGTKSKPESAKGLANRLGFLANRSTH